MLTSSTGNFEFVMQKCANVDVIVSDSASTPRPRRRRLQIFPARFAGRYVVVENASRRSTYVSRRLLSHRTPTITLLTQAAAPPTSSAGVTLPNTGFIS
ncbi:unnamed protein product [Heligmosomoides polygyrus]|uniref:MSP domain-containing protein n=1 Tax=Heligmosomoides polygyrus TaxID=6339 RepID=A0A183GUL8_HELPZ|nr:unnamed protein product [Heligmosomoides polygyrus]